MVAKSEKSKLEEDSRPLGEKGELCHGVCVDIFGNDTILPYQSTKREAPRGKHVGRTSHGGMVLCDRNRIFL